VELGSSGPALPFAPIDEAFQEPPDEIVVEIARLLKGSAERLPGMVTLWDSVRAAKSGRVASSWLTTTRWS